MKGDLRQKGKGAKSAKERIKLKEWNHGLHGFGQKRKSDWEHELREFREEEEEDIKKNKKHGTTEGTEIIEKKRKKERCFSP